MLGVAFGVWALGGIALPIISIAKSELLHLLNFGLCG